MSRKVLILVEGHRGSGPLYIQSIQNLGLQPITLSTDPAQYDYLKTENSQAVRVDTDSLAALTHECTGLRAFYDIAGITGFTALDELLYARVGKLCQHFDLP
ncbi:MAG: hypothetical protein EOR42_31675, partial [Mesorhizobium sp.]